MAMYSSILAWKFSWIEEPGELYSPLGRKELDDLACTQICNCTVLPSFIHFLTLLNNYFRAFFTLDFQYFPFLTFD